MFLIIVSRTDVFFLWFKLSCSTSQSLPCLLHFHSLPALLLVTVSGAISGGCSCLPEVLRDRPRPRASFLCEATVRLLPEEAGCGATKIEERG